MRVYRIDYHDADVGTLVRWEPTIIAARQFVADENIDDPHIEAVNVPTRKADLLQWLNRNLDTDNG